MKTLLSILYCYFFVFALTVNAKEHLSLGNEVKEYDKIFEKIAERRMGIDFLKLEKLENPFVVIGKFSTEDSLDGNSTVEPVYILEATLDQKAKINGKWYTRKDKVGFLDLVRVNHNSVILQNESEKKEIFIRTKDETNIKILSK